MRTISVIGLAAIVASGALACSGSKSETKADESAEATTEKPAEGETGAEETATEETAEGTDEAAPEEGAAPPVALADADADQLEAMFTVSGSVDREQVRGIIGQKKDTIYECYKSVLPDNPELAGKMLVSITSSADGQVVSAVIKDSTIEVVELKQCMTKAIKKWKFPAPTDGGLVMTTYAFVLPP
jgi:hypothetical protein